MGDSLSYLDNLLSTTIETALSVDIGVSMRVVF